MNPIRFHSCLARQMQRFVELRQWTGRDYGSQALNLTTAESPLFVNRGGQRLPKRSAEGNFQCVMRACGIGRRGRNHPTPHSLRHSFACHCLLEWYREGGDINARLPVLATYMGHADMRFTYRYLHATPELLGQANRRFLDHYHQIINTEVTHE